MNALGRPILKGPRGGEYVLDASGKKVYKFKRAPVEASPEVPKDVLGREILKGPKGGLYVLDSRGKKVYSFIATASTRRLAKGRGAADARPANARPAAVPAPVPAPAASPKNTLGRKILKGPKGGEYVLDSRGKKVYKFKRATTAAGPSNTYSNLPPMLNFQRALLEVPIIRFNGATFSKMHASRKIGVYKAHSNRQNVFVMRNTNVDALMPWFKKQAEFIDGLRMDDFLTVSAYANKSHTWIGPYLAKKSVKTLADVSKAHAKPLFPQMKKLIDSYSSAPNVDLVLSFGGIRSSVTNVMKEKYAEFCDKTKMDAQRYAAYSYIFEGYGMYQFINKNFMQIAMDMYAKDLQSIILRSPPVEKSMFLYRGSRSMYMKLDRKHAIKSFSSAAFVPSYPLAYGKQGYHRIELLQGSHALALAIVNPWNSVGEYEILLPMGVEYTPKFDRGVKRWIVKDEDPRHKATYVVSNFTVKTP